MAYTTTSVDSVNSSDSSGLVQPQVTVDQRKRKRMESNRESARRSRVRKRKVLADLMAQSTHLMKENTQILAGIDLTTQHLLKIESENSVLRAQVAELSQRLQSLDEILHFMYTANGVSETEEMECIDDGLMNPMNMLCFQQPIMAAGAGDALFQY